MARSPRRAPRGRRQPEPDPYDVVEPIDELEPIPSRGRGAARRGGGRPPAGGGGMTIGAKIITITIPPVAILALLFGLLIVSKAGDAPKGVDVAKDIHAAVDAGGVAAVRLLTAPEPSSWDAEQFTWSSVRDTIEKRYKKVLAEKYSIAEDSRNSVVQERELGKFQTDILDVYIPKDEHEATRIAQLQKRLDLAGLGEGFLGASLSVKVQGGGNFSRVLQRIELSNAQGVARYGETNVSEGIWNGKRVRRYTHPVRDWRNVEQGKAQVYLEVPEPPKAAASTGGGIKALALIMIVVIIGAAVVSAFILTNAISAPLKGLVRDIDAVARGDTERRFQTRGGGEISLIARHLEKMTYSLVAQKTAEVEQLTAEAEFSIASAIQENILPAAPPRLEGYEIEALYKPNPDLGTDYHDFIHIDDTHLGVIIADASAKGTTGAMIMSQVRSLIRAYGPESLSPSETLRRVNHVFAKDLKKGLYVTASYMVVDLESGVVAVANAGHHPTVFWKLSKRAIARLAGEGLALGLDEGPVFDDRIEDKRVQLEAGDRVLVFTDGAVEAENIHQEIYGEDAFFDLVKREAPKNSAAFVNMVANEIDLFHEGAVQKDDITLVTIRKVR